MKDGIRMSALNLRQVQSQLNQLPKKIGAVALRKAIRAGAEVFKADLDGGDFPTWKGKMKKSIKITLRRPGDAGSYGTKTIGVDVGVFTWYARLVEYGHKWVVKKGKGKGGKVIATGTEPPNPFMRNTFDASENAMKMTIAAVLAVTIPKAVGKLK